MKKLFIYTLLIHLFFNITGSAKDNFFDEAKNMYDKKKLEDLKSKDGKRYNFKIKEIK